MTIRLGESWLNNVWGVLVLEVRPNAPQHVRELHERSGGHFYKSGLRVADTPHAFCLVLYDHQGSWVEGSTLWIDFGYIISHCKLEGSVNAQGSNTLNGVA